MLPVIALVGRPNVGKSTLFNRLTRSRDALVADQPGLTRDRKYGVGKLGSSSYLAVDTGGISGGLDGIDQLMVQQVQLAIDEADHILFLVDAREGYSAGDQSIAAELRKKGKPITLVVNKSDGVDSALTNADFYGMGLGEPIPISSAHGMGVKTLIEEVLLSLPIADEEEQDSGIRLAVVGRPNVGKSTLVNRLLGEERVLAFDQPGTTRDSIFIPLEHKGQRYTLIDTAGVRRRAKVHEVVEKFSIIKTLQAIEQANVILLVLDAEQGISEQDATLAGHILDSGRALIVVTNKWDTLDKEDREQLKEELERKLPFLGFARHHYISALRGSGVAKLLSSVDKAYANATADLSTPQLTRILEQAVQQHTPPLVRGRRIKMRYAHQGGQNPPIIVIHGNQTESVPNAYERYLINKFRSVLKLDGTPIRLEFRSSDNPYEGRKNKLSDRQIKKRQRLKKFTSRKK